MAQRCALIVDDSRTARKLLGEVLSAHHLRVDMAASAEEALDYLSRTRPDVIFMDHLMPGMDGLQAVQAIKENPATATIPIMMYTSQEGELYVGQARALGAIGVLPKQIKPVEVSRLLRSLHLVNGDGPEEAAPAGASRAIGEVAEVTTDLNHRDWTDLHRWLQEMFDHLGQDLRSDIETSIEAGVERSLQQREAAAAGRRRLAIVPVILTLTLTGIAATFLWLHLDTQKQWRAAVAQNVRLMAALNARRTSASVEAVDNAEQMDSARDALTDRYHGFLAALEWGVNRSARYAPDQVPFGDERMETLSGLLQQLSRLGFAGTVHLDSHIGDFCYVNAAADGLQLAPDELPAERCDRIGLPAEEARSASARQSVAFANFLTARDPAAAVHVELESGGNTAPVAPYPSSPQGMTAGDWNRIARENNRVTIRITPDRAGT